MASQVQIANRALTKLGQARVISLGDDVKTASTINSMYDAVLEAELRSHVWNFAKAREVLPALAAKPAFDFERQYQLPADCLRILRVGDTVIHPRRVYDHLYSIEGRHILTNLGAPLRIRYVRKVTDPNQFDALFAEVFACKLALEACEDLTQSAGAFQRVASMYAQALRDAIRANALERPAEAINDDTWLESRR